ncbi:MAG: hypothetical protein ABEL76_12305, partial [Bradymonadaceae bacterium]
MEFASALARGDGAMMYAAGTDRGFGFVSDPPPGDNMLLVRFAPDQTVTWTTAIGSDGDQDVKDVAVDNRAGVYLAGSSDADLGDQTHAGDGDAVLARVDAETGDLQWARFIGGEGRDDAFAVDVGPNGSVYVGG